MFVTGAYGLGENVVQGAVDPDEFYVHKPTYLAGHRAVLRRLIGDKAVKMIFVEGGTKDPVRNIPTPKADRARFCITYEDVVELAGYACTIEQHYKRPMDMEWAKDGIDGKLYIVQARPETVASQRSGTTLENYVLEGRGEVLTEGRSVGQKIAAGAVRRIEHLEHLSDFQPGEVLVSDITTPDWEPVMKVAAAIVTNRGGRTCHAAIISRELGIPAVVGTGDATTEVPNGEVVTVSCAEVTPGVFTRAKWPYASIGPRSATWLGRVPRSCSIWETPTSPSRRRSYPTTAWGSPGWNSSSTSTSRSTRWPCCTRTRSTTLRREGRSIG